MRGLIVCLLVLANFSLAQAQEAENIERRAMELTQQALEHYRSGDLEQSLSLLQEARQLVRQPVIIYNLARVHEDLGNLEEALSHFQEYLDMDPDARDHGAIAVRIETLEEQLEERDRLLAEQQEARETASRLESRADEAERRAQQASTRRSIWPWLLTGIGFALLSAAAVLGALALREANELGPEDNHLVAQSAQQRADNLALSANIGFASGGVLAGAGLTWGIVRLILAKRDDETQVGLSFQGSF